MKGERNIRLIYFCYIVKTNYALLYNVRHVLLFITSVKEIMSHLKLLHEYVSPIKPLKLA